MILDDVSTSSFDELTFAGFVLVLTKKVIVTHVSGIVAGTFTNGTHDVFVRSRPRGVRASSPTQIVLWW